MIDLEHQYLRRVVCFGLVILALGGCASIQERVAKKIEYILPKDEVSPGDVLQVGFVLPEEIRGGYVVFLKKRYRVFPRRDLGHRTYEVSLAVPKIAPGDYEIHCFFKAKGAKKIISEKLMIQVLPDFMEHKVEQVKAKKFNRDMYMQDRLKIQRHLRSSSFSPKRKQDFILPLGGEIVSNFGTMRKYGEKAEVALEGLEIKSVSASVLDINAVADGKVLMAESLPMLGNVVLIDHGFSVATLYCHLRNVEVKAGQDVLRGDRLGLVGATGGAAVGTRLYYQLFVAGIPADIQRYSEINIFQ